VTELLKSLPHEIGAAIVIIQHLDPKHASLSTDILSRVSPMPVDEVKDGTRIQQPRLRHSAEQRLAPHPRRSETLSAY
jgi:two-component system CheB/CheR fusion protein